MFQKVLVAEDYESASISVQKSLTDLNIADAGFVYYCDEALALLRKSLDQNKPFDLLITDLSFEEDFAKQNLKSGKELIIEARKLLPTLKILVFSGEKRPLVIKELFEDLEIDGFVSKGRMDVKNLKTAITTIFENKKYISSENLHQLRKTDNIELSLVEFSIIKLLSEGIFQKDMTEILKEKSIKPNSLSSVEKTLNNLKETFAARSTEHLVAICKDLGVL
ncbi:response regulator [Kaistella sp. 97-N-M2]|uniref:response regulator n=1 Tax=Kaistella sp. 97-N-M2 TaxID=2908645 RepID=UPI001F33D12A|nr:response regulator [Kaistella sp. 97-N-M2]UJF29558.1 response regulator [Kaistella sp. 97-N-M2]